MPVRQRGDCALIHLVIILVSFNSFMFAKYLHPGASVLMSDLLGVK